MYLMEMSAALGVKASFRTIRKPNIAASVSNKQTHPRDHCTDENVDDVINRQSA
jgi:hypothetical protein